MDVILGREAAIFAPEGREKMSKNPTIFAAEGRENFAHWRPVEAAKRPFSGPKAPNGAQRELSKRVTITYIINRW